MNFITEAFAQSSDGASQTGNVLSQILLIAVFVLIFYLLIWRPQAKRAKEHRNLMEQLVVGDEISTSGGVIGKILEIKGDCVVLKINSDGTTIQIQKSHITSVLPKGTSAL
jgi:preprotein translocase subunit YajC